MAKQQKKQKKGGGSGTVSLPAPASASGSWCRSPWFLAVAGVTCLGLLLRAVGLGYISLWGDELYHVFAAESLVTKGMPVLPTGQLFDSAYLFTWLISLVQRVAGSTEATNRLVPMLFGVATIPLTYFVGMSIYRDRRVSLIGALLIAVLPWYIIRAQVIRMYTMFQACFLFAVWLFHKGFEAKQGWWFNKSVENGGSIGKFALEQRLHIGFLAASLPAFYLSLHVMGFAFEAGPAILMYALIVFILQVRQSGFKSEALSKYALVVYICLAGLIFSPVLFNVLFYNPFSKYFPSLSDWLTRMSADPWFGIKRYGGDAAYLHPWIWLVGLAGMAGVFIRFNKRKLFVFCMFIVPFMLQSMVFNDSNSIKIHYLFFVFPFFLLMTANGFILGADMITDKMLANVSDRTRAGHIVLGLLIAVFMAAPLKKTYETVFNKHHGDQKDRATERYANWREAADYVKRRWAPDDMILSVQPWSVYHYFGKSDYQLRMGFLNFMFLREEYEKYGNFRKNPNPPVWPMREMMSNGKILRDYNMFAWTMERYSKGWLVACHKFFNPAFVDRRVQQFVKKNMKFRKTDKDQSVFVYRWNSGGPIARPLFEVAEKREYNFKLPAVQSLPDTLIIQVDLAGCDGRDMDKFLLNGHDMGNFRYVTSPERQIVEAVLDKNWLRGGSNTLTFVNDDKERPFTVYHVGLTMKRGEIFISVM